MTVQTRLEPPPARVPAATPARMSALATLPLFFELTGRRTVVAGSSDAALWKAELLSAAGSDLLVLAGDEDGATRFQHLSGPAATVTVEPRSWRWLMISNSSSAPALGSGT